MRVSGADTLSRFVFEGAAVRGARVRLAETADAMLAPHAYPPALKRVLVELAGAAALLAAALKFDGRLSVQLAGDGPVRLIVVECNPNLALRATAQWSEEEVDALGSSATLEQLAGGAASGARLAIMLDPRDAGPLYQGIVALDTPSVAATIEHYLTTSEQVQSRLELVVEDGAVSGLLLQRMPASGPADETKWTQAVAALDAAAPHAIVAAAADNEGLARLFAEHDLRVFKPSVPRFACSCSRERVESALRIAGRDEVEAALLSDGRVEVKCEFCGRAYSFDPEEARALFADREASVPPTRH
jgi:molecular chaperone Hsp33